MDPKPDHLQLMERALKELWGYPDFRPHQRESIQAILEGRDSLTVLPTGGGKSLCYQLPAAITAGTALVVSPLISLMADQVQALNLLGIPAACLNSAQRGEEVRQAKAMLFQGRLKLLYVSPERLSLDRFLEELGQVSLSFIAIDEAHCISQWGHDFRPEYAQLGAVRKRFPKVSVHGFTATAPPEVRSEIAERLELREPRVFIGDYCRANLIYKVIQRDRLKEQILRVVKAFSDQDSGIVYCLTRKETERVAEFLQDQGRRALPYHAGMDAETRKRHQELFSQEKVHIMAATVAFGMGIDQSNVRFVIHAGMPRTLSHYQQEAGRAGRDGLPAQCVLIYGGNDILFWKRIIEEEGVLSEQRNRQLRQIIDYAALPRCRHKTLVEHFGQPFEKPNCGACDVCLGEIETLAEARTYSRMILSAALKLKQAFGGAHLAQVLAGSRDQKVLQNGHDKLSVYGLLKQYAQNQIQDWTNQLESQGYLKRASGNYPTLGLTQAGYWLLRPDKYGKTERDLPVMLVETRKRQTKAAPSGADAGAPYDGELFEKLRAARAELAAKLGVPAFVVFGDRSLQDMARRRPVNERDFLDVFGVGAAKLQKFGKVMMGVIREHEESVEEA